MAPNDEDIERLFHVIWSLCLYSQEFNQLLVRQLHALLSHVKQNIRCFRLCEPYSLSATVHLFPPSSKATKDKNKQMGTVVLKELYIYKHEAAALASYSSLPHFVPRAVGTKAQRWRSFLLAFAGKFGSPLFPGSRTHSVPRAVGTEAPCELLLIKKIWLRIWGTYFRNDTNIQQNMSGFLLLIPNLLLDHLP